MNRIFTLILGLAVFLFSNIAPAAPVVHLESAAVINQPIMGGNLEPINKFVLESIGKRGSIDLIINSPGGSVSDGFSLLNRMDYARSKGVVINCFVPEIAASMAFQILLHCDNRYALPRAGLLWHRVSIRVRGASLNTLVLSDLLKDLGAVDNLIIQDLVENMPLSKEKILFHLDRETLHIAQDLAELAPGFLTGTPTTVDGLLEAMNSDKVVRQSEESDFLKKLFGGEIIYIRRDTSGETDFYSKGKGPLRIPATRYPAAD